jgi:hypothetical protein
MIYHLPSEHKKKKWGWKEEEDGRETLCVCVCWCNHRHKVSMSKRWNKKKIKKISKNIYKHTAQHKSGSLSSSCSRFLFLKKKEKRKSISWCPHMHNRPKKKWIFHGLRQSKILQRSYILDPYKRENQNPKNNNWKINISFRVTNFLIDLVYLYIVYTYSSIVVVFFGGLEKINLFTSLWWLAGAEHSNVLHPILVLIHLNCFCSFSSFQFHFRYVDPLVSFFNFSYQTFFYDDDIKLYNYK